ncbi:ABC transporter permease [Pseudoruegeria sp. SHC-113]|uniref:ABC transporter permease n=1 Tax=Pseudoruegeria sp. SHC-113 TaxID=2855439 RepID=UPI0021BA948B|nr:ABC transporter permease [Pseudoruegeria sp. SHC-113]MCT8162153.1 ABC transporter permease [Pseudoruegeria sp. SHC-113]
MSGQSRKNPLTRQKWMPILLATLGLAALLSVAAPAFLSFANMQSILVQASVTAIMAIGMTFVITTAGIDISVGAILFFTSALFAKLMLETGSYPLAFAAAMLCATLLGALNGLLIVRFRVSPLITTLATYSIYRGAAIHLTEAQNIPVPREMGFLGNGRIFGVPVPILILAVVFLLGVYLFTQTRFGVYIRALGASQRSAHETGLPVDRVTVLAYGIGGFLTGIAALVLLARVGGLQSGIGIGIEFTVIAAVILGGTKLTGGTGTVAGSVIGAVFLVLIDNGLNLMNASPYIYDAVRGAVLLAAVVVDRLSTHRRHVTLEKRKRERLMAAA